jgi:septal ring factor EnvC (AmiA/AmiB activator)
MTPHRMKRTFLVVALALVALFPITQAHAQSETDKLRDAVRSLTAQTRSLEDQRAAMQSQLAASDKEKEKLRHDLDASKDEVKKLEKEQREAVEQFNQRLTEHEETLAKWKTAYEEAATVARSKDAERAKFETQANAFKASTHACQEKNVELVKVGRELLHRYEGATIGTALVTSEPLTGIGRTEIQNLLQDYGDKILDQKDTP